MQNVETAASQIKDLLSRSGSVLIVTKADPSLDSVAASLALAKVASHQGRQITLVSPAVLPERVRQLTGSEMFVQTLPTQSLIITLDSPEGSIDKISYAAEGDKFKMVVTPRSGQQINSEHVNFAYSGQTSDLVITIGVADLGLLGTLYESDKQVWSERPLINIDRHGANTQFGKINIIDHEASSVSEIMARLLLASKLHISKQAAELLLIGIKDATTSYETAGPGDFETAAKLTRVIKAERGESTEERLVNEPFRKGEALRGATAI